MSLERIVIVSSPSTLAEMYVKNGDNGLIVEKDVDKFREVIYDIIAGKYDSIGKKARQSFLEEFSRKRLGEEYGKYVR